MSKSIKEIVKEHINVPGLLDDVLDEIVDKVLSDLVASTNTVFDDVLKGALYGPLSDAIKIEVQKLWDSLLEEASPVVNPVQEE